MEYIVYIGIILVSLVFLIFPFLRGTSQTKFFQELDQEKKRKEDREQNIKDDIESTKLALRDLDMENKIGKISNDDYEVLKDELLDEWKSAEEEFKQIKKI